MKRQTKDLLWYIALLVLTLSVAVLVPSWRLIYYFLILFPLLSVPLAFGFMLRSWWQFLVSPLNHGFMLAAIVCRILLDKGELERNTVVNV
jgi:hypothetical protein